MEVESDIQINTYNTNKKISQLNKVIQYLSYHLQERIFQVETIKKKYETKEAEIINQIDDKIKPVFEQLNLDKVEIENTVNKYYQNKRDVMFQAFRAKEEKVNNQIQFKINEIQNEIKSVMTTIENINSTLDDQFKFLNDKSKSDVSTIRLKIIQLQKDHQLSLKKFDAEENKKIKQLEEKSQKTIKEMQEMHKSEMNQIKSSKIDSQPQLSDRMIKSLKNSKNHILTLKTTIENQTKEVNKQKKIFQQNIVAFKERLKLFSTNYSSILENNSKLLQSRKEENEKIYDELNNEEQKLKMELNSLKQRLENEYMLLENDIKLARGQIKSKREEKQKEFIARSQKGEDYIMSYFQSLMDEIAQVQNEHRLERQSYKSVHEKLEGDIKNFDENHMDDFNKLNKEKENDLFEFNKEKEMIENEFKNRIKKEIEVFHKLKNQYEDKIQHLSNTQSEFSKNEEELKKLQVVLETNKRSFSSSITNLLNSINEELSNTQKELNEKYEKVQNQIESQYQVEVAKSQTEIEAYKAKLENEYLKRIKEIDENYQNSIEQFRLMTIENNQKELSSKNDYYEKMYNDSVTELNSIVVPEGIMELTDEAINHLEKKLKQLPGSVKDQKIDLEREKSRLLDEEEDRHKKQLLEYLSYCRESHENDYENYQKELKEKISGLDAEIDHLREELKMIEKVSPRLLITGDGLDLEKQKLEDELFAIRNDLKEKVKIEERKKIDNIKELNDQIEEQLENNKNEIKKEKEIRKHETEVFKKSYEENRLRRKEINEASHKSLNIGVREFNDQFEKMTISHSDRINQMQLEIIEMKNKNSEDIESIQTFLESERKRLDKEGRKIARNLPKELKSLKENIHNMNPELDKRIKEATNRRDTARNAMINKPMRQEEANVIKRLESQLSVKTTQLTKVGKELLQYRQTLIHQENEYNNRFGVDPSVAVMKPVKSRPKTTLDGRRLPKLYNSAYV